MKEALLWATVTNQSHMRSEAQLLLYNAWRELLLIILTDRYITVRSGGGEMLFYQCLGQQLHRLEAYDIPSPLCDRMSEVVLFLVSKIRENSMDENITTGDVSLDQLFTLLKSMVILINL